MAMRSGLREGGLSRPTSGENFPAIGRPQVPPERKTAALSPRDRRLIGVHGLSCDEFRLGAAALPRQLTGRAGHQQARSNERQTGREAPPGESGEAVAAAQVLRRFPECPREPGVGDPDLSSDSLAGGVNEWGGGRRPCPQACPQRSLRIDRSICISSTGAPLTSIMATSTPGLGRLGGIRTL